MGPGNSISPLRWVEGSQRISIYRAGLNRSALTNSCGLWWDYQAHLQIKKLEGHRLGESQSHG